MRILMTLLPLILFFIAVRAIATEPLIGWHWYNEKSTVKKNSDQDKKINLLYQKFLKLPYHLQLEILQKSTEELKDKAILTGNVSDITAFKRAQDMWVSKATQFTVGWQRMLLEHPELNYSLQYSHENALAPVMQQHEHQMQNEAIAKLSKNNGLLLFYRADHTADLMFAKVVLAFSKDHHIPIMLVSENKPQHFTDVKNLFDSNGQHAHELNVYYFPAVLLVNPKNRSHQIVSYGYKSEDELAERLLSIANNWKPNF